MIKTRRTKRTFYPEFKLEAIEQVVKYQRDVREVALALELNPDHLSKWIRLYKQELQGIEPAGNCKKGFLGLRDGSAGACLGAQIMVAAKGC
ncbi:transposase [Escherichia coli]|nr:transposase [Escherichia coli]EEY3206702.1 transposase [Escherichia coli]EFD4966576.1 transposase [Escherichia coli]EFE0785567.1 transposase [Escherichia coli]EFF2501891.1 transposase [Escherichia coli]